MPPIDASSFALAAFDVLLVALSAAWAAGDARCAWRAVASLRWPVVTGTILAVGWKRGRNESCRPFVVYAYSVGGTEYRGRRIANWGGFLSDRSFTERGVRDLTSRWREGQPAEVRYHPSTPGLSVLLPGPTWRLAFSLLSSLSLLAFLVWLFVLPAAGDLLGSSRPG